MASSRTIYLGIKGSVIALDSSTGAQLWATHLTGSDFVNIVLDGDKLYATTHGEIFCLDPSNGEGRWSNSLKGYGFGLCTIASETVAPGNFVNVFAEFIPQREAAAAAASATSTT